MRPLNWRRSSGKVSFPGCLNCSGLRNVKGAYSLGDESADWVVTRGQPSDQAETGAYCFGADRCFQWICGSGGLSASRPMKASRKWCTISVPRRIRVRKV